MPLLTLVESWLTRNASRTLTPCRYRGASVSAFQRHTLVTEWARHAAAGSCASSSVGRGRGRPLHSSASEWDAFLASARYTDYPAPSQSRDTSKLSHPHAEQGEYGLDNRNGQPAHGPHSIKVHFRDAKGQPLKTIEASEGDNVLDLAHEYDIDLEGASVLFYPPCLSLSFRRRRMRRLGGMFDMPRYSDPGAL